jgi:serine protease Do
MRRIITYGPALVVLLTICVVLLAAPAAVYRIQMAETRARIVLAQAQLDSPDNILEAINRATRQVATAMQPSVVSLEVMTAGRRFGVRSTGSGWVFDGRGHIVTNAHVVRGAEAISVEFADGRVVQTERIRGEPFLADPFTDVAVIKVSTEAPLFPARRATGVRPQVGDRVFAFGSPFGFKFSMSEGIVSGLARDPGAAVLAGGFTNFIQTDAAVNPGNSGGPLVDVQGRVIGMNVAIATGRESQGTTEGQSAGISFAIPLLTVESVVTQLIETGRVSRGFLGIRWGAADEPVVYMPELGKRGVQVVEVTAEGPAETAGVRAGDIITSIAGQPVFSMETLRTLVTSLRPGQPVEIDAYRDGKAVSFQVKLGEFPRETLVQQAGLNALSLYGLIVRRAQETPVVQAVLPQSAAASDGFAQGQLITHVGGRRVLSWLDVAVAAEDAGLLLGRPVAFTVQEGIDREASTSRTIDVRITR